MRYPEFLKKNDIIGFVAPSFGCNIEPYRSGFLSAQKKFKELGYGLDFGPNCYEGAGIGISNTPQKCAEELMEFYQSDSNQVLISCGGGELMCEILNAMDFEKLKQAVPKWYLGYSDNTNMTFLLTTICDVASIYGPCAPAFGMMPWAPSIWDAYHCLTGEKTVFHGYEYWEKESLKTEENPTAPYHLTEKKELKSYLGAVLKPNEEIEFEGRLIGGCMDCLVNLLGTSFDKVKEFDEKYKEDGFIWFLESCDLNVFAIRRAIWQMKNAGWFRYMKGFLIGRPLVFGQEMIGLDQYHAVIDLLQEYEVPVIMDVDFGHLPPSIPLICGSYAKVRVENNEIQIDMGREISKN